MLFELAPEHVRTLDEYEGYDGPGEATNLYERVEREVVAADGDAITAIIYVMLPAKPGLPSRRYVEAILAGMVHHGLPEETIRSLRDAPTAPA